MNLHSEFIIGGKGNIIWTESIPKRRPIYIFN